MFLDFVADIRPIGRKMSVSCRFYKHRYPKQEDVVMVNVRSIAEMGAYVTLLEYNNIEGMIMLSELSRRRIRSINKLVRIGRNECVVVIRVDETKGNVYSSGGIAKNGNVEVFSICSTPAPQCKMTNSGCNRS